MEKLASGNSVKWLFIALIIFQSLFLAAQEAPKFDLALTCNSLIQETSPVILDSVLVSSGSKRSGVWFTDPDKNDSVFTISGLSIGKYRLFPSANGFLILPQTVVVCSKCGKNIDFRAMPSKEKFPDQIFDFVEISPTYIGGQKAMAGVFRKVLSISEMQEISKSPDFNVHFFVTKYKEISDITFSPAILDPGIQSIIIKAINALSNWQAAVSNGRESDGETSLPKSLFTQL